MPLKWIRGINPYVVNYFGKLQIGPNTPPRQFQPQATRFIQKLTAGNSVELGGHPLDDYAISEAAKKLLEPAARAEELLLAHPQSKNESGNLKSLCDKLKQTAILPEYSNELELLQPDALFWFLPDPGSEVADLPEFDELGLTRAGDESDRELDIVFDE